MVLAVLAVLAGLAAMGVAAPARADASVDGAVLRPLLGAGATAEDPSVGPLLGAKVTADDPGTSPGPIPIDRRLAAGSVTAVTVAGPTGVPADAGAVALNVTATSGLAAGYVTAYPCGQAVPATSSLNFAAGQTVANSVIVAVGTAGQVCVFTSSPVAIVVDLAGWFAPGAFGAVAPARLLDTRTAGGRLAARGSLSVPVAGRAGVPATAAAVAVNVTATNTAGDGYLTVYPCGQPVPNVSNANYRAGQTVAGAAVVAVTGNGAVCVTSYASADIVVDVTGWLGANGFLADGPRRLVDTRAGRSVAAGGSLAVAVPAAPGTAVALTVTAAPLGQAGYLTVYPCDGPVPGSSNVNYGTRRPVPNLAVTLVASDRTVCVFTSQAAHLIVDWFGTLPADGGFSGITPVRLYDSRGITDDTVPPGLPPLPPDGGAGRRIVYANGQQRVWLVEDDGSVVRTYLVSGKWAVPPPGTYHVYSKSRYACSVTCTAFMEYMVRFAVSERGNGIGFHSIPTRADGTPLQDESALGEFRSAGCVRQAVPDAIFLWNWAPVGTTVVVTR